MKNNTKPVSKSYTVGLSDLLEIKLAKLGLSDLEDAQDNLKWFFDNHKQRETLCPALSLNNVEDIVDEIAASMTYMDTSFIFQQYFYVTMFMRELQHFLEKQCDIHSHQINGLDISILGDVARIEVTISSPPNNSSE